MAQSEESKSPGASWRMDLVYLLGAVVLFPILLWRKFVKRKRSAPWKLKMGHLSVRTRTAPRVWIHAVSVGEANTAETLFKALRKHNPAFDVVVSTTTVTGNEVAVKRYGAENVFQFPFDFSSAVRRAFDHVQPDILVLMELEVWPNVTAEAAHRGIPAIVVNGRITERAARRYKRGWFLVGPSFSRVNKWLQQTDEYAARVRQLGVAADRIEVSGNLKYDAVDTQPLSAERRAEVRKSLGIENAAPVVIGGSTHPTEEAALLKAYTSLRREIPALRLILVPRHPERLDAVENEIKAAGFACLRRSKMPPAQSDAVLLIDTMGELKQMYAAADAAYVGGSLIPHGGQNVMEPCGLGIPTIHGSHMHNFNEAMTILRSCRGSIEVSGQTLEATLRDLLTNRAGAQAMAARAREAFLKEQGATARAVNCIAKLVQADAPE